MAKTHRLDDLLTEAVQDLAAAARLTTVRLAKIVDRVDDPALRATFDEVVAAAHQQVAALEASGRGEGGPENLWMAGILDDAKRDARSNARGPVRDTALLGAVRKGLAATTVSYDTAVALAHSSAPLARMLRAQRTRVRALDKTLSAALARIVAADQL
jgi:ferritin-like metal-binding protein YciE